MTKVNSTRITYNKYYNKEVMNSDELKAFMDKHGLSIREFSEIFGVTTVAVGYWLSGERKVSITSSRLIRLFDKYPRLLEEF